MQVYVPYRIPFHPVHVIHRQMSYPRSSTALLNRCTAAELPVILMKFRPKDRGT
ncbi:hypothetical protein Plhal304r1_c046g0127721 [Plasmopara halstedii]